MLANLLLMAYIATEPNYDEAKVPGYTLPDLLTFADGQPVAQASDWPARRAEILELFETEVYGKTPEIQLPMEVEAFAEVLNAQDGTIVQQQVILRFGEASPEVNLLIYRPKAATQPVPAFLGLNFNGNHTVRADPGICITEAWMRNNADLGVSDNRASEQGRGGQADRWAIETILNRGYALATIYYGDIDPDFDDGFQNGVHPLFNDLDREKRAADAWGSIGTWAWGLSCALDYLETDSNIDASKVAVMGHSRLGKTSLWAGAQDPRFALVISNNSGCGGAALSRRRFGETVGRINRSFPHWFCHNFNQYNGKEDQLPVDQHQLIALIAPRPVYVASAVEDLWADPKGEFLAAKHADSVYRLLGTDGLPADQMPDLDQAVMGQIGYHVRSGGHNVTLYDWERYLDFADRHLR